MSNSFNLKITDIKNPALQKLAWTYDVDDNVGYLSKEEFFKFKEQALKVENMSDEDFNQAMGLYKSDDAPAADNTVDEKIEDEFNNEDENNEVNKSKLEATTSRVIDLREEGTGAEEVFSSLQSVKLGDDDSADGGFSAINNGLRAKAENCLKKLSDPEISEEEKTKIRKELYDVEDNIAASQSLAQHYTRQNYDQIEEALQEGNVMEHTLPNGKKMYIVSQLSIKGNNNSANSATDNDKDDKGDKEQATNSNDYSKIIGGFIAAGEAYTDKFQILGEIDVGTNDFDGIGYLKYEDTTKHDNTISITGGGGITTGPTEDVNDDGKIEKVIETNTRAAGGVDFKMKNGFFASSTVFYNSQKTGDDRDWSLDVTGNAGYEFSRDDNNFFKVNAGGFYSTGKDSDFYGGVLGCNGKGKLDNGLNIGGKFKANVGNLAFKGENSGVPNNLLFASATASVYANMKIDDLKFKAGAMFQADMDSDYDEETNNRDYKYSFMGSLNAAIQKGRYSLSTMVNFIGKEVIPNVCIQVDNVLVDKLGIRAGWTGRSSFENPNSPGTFSVGLVLTGVGANMKQD